MAFPNTDALETTNENTGILENLFSFNEKESFYTHFYNSFLTLANSLPLNNLWVAYIVNIPAHVPMIAQSYESKWGVVEPEFTKVKTMADDPKGLLIAQGVKIIGDGFGTERMGYKNTGYIQGVVGMGRNPFEVLSISFMENNVSFVDYVLRPWSIAVAHNSLKDSSLKTNIIVWHLSKMGANKDLARRKVTVYEDCAPINIDTCEYNYTGTGDVLKQRNVQFVFNKYHMESIDSTLLDLIQAGPPGFLDKMLDGLKRQFGANDPKQYVNNLIDKAKDFGKDLVGGTVGRIVTNAGGKISDTINSAINGLESSARGAANNLVGSVNDLVGNAIDKLAGNKDNDSIGGRGGAGNSMSLGQLQALDTNRQLTQLQGSEFYKEVKIREDDYSEHVRPTITDNQYSLLKVDTDKKVEKAYIERLVNRDPTNNNQEFPDVSNANDDTVMYNTPLNYTLKEIDQNDTVGLLDKIPYKDIKTDQSDYVSGKHDLSTYVENNTNKNDFIEKHDLSTFKQVNISENDYVKKNDRLSEYKQVNISEDDYVKKSTLLNYNIKEISQDDYVKKSTPLNVKLVDIPQDDYVSKSTPLKYTIKEISK